MRKFLAAAVCCLVLVAVPVQAAPSKPVVGPFIETLGLMAAGAILGAWQ